MASHETAAPAAEDPLTDIPLTDAQLGLWLSQQVRPDADDLHILRAFRVSGPLDARALARALDQVVTAHPALRSLHPFDRESPVRRVLPAPGTAPWHDLAGTAQDLAAFHRRPFDLEEEPPLRAGLSGTGPGGSRLLALCFHHIAMDGVSAAVFCRDLAEAYRTAASLPDSRARHGVPPAAPAAVPRPRQDPRPDRTAAYWADRLRRLPEPLLYAPAAEVPPTGRRARVHRLRHGTADLLALRDTARAHGATPHMVLTAAYAAALGRVFGREEVVVGCTVSLRGPRQAHVIDCLVTLLPLVVRLGVDAGALLEQVRDHSLEAQRHRSVTGEVLARCAGTRPMEPLFQAAIDVQLAPPTVLELHGCDVEALEAEPGATQYPVDLDIRLADDGLRLILRTDPSCVSDRQAGELLPAIGDLLPSPTRSPATVIGGPA